MGQNRDIRKILHSALAAIQSDAENKSLSALTLDHMIQEQIDVLKPGSTSSVLDVAGKAVSKRLSRWDELDILMSDLTQVVKAIKNAGNDPQALEDLNI